MKLRGIDFGHVLGASGGQGFFGEGYWFHKYLKPFGLDFEGMTFVAKTTTFDPRTGNMALDEDLTPKHLFPNCIVVKPFKGVVLNSVGLSGPGAWRLFKDGRWQKREKPFFISFMSVSDYRNKRLDELREFISVFKVFLSHGFKAPASVGLQLNFSCPNVGLHSCELADEIYDSLSIASTLDIPLMPKLNVLFPLEVVKEISEHPHCDALCISNTIPWGKLPDKINWKGLFGSDVSPLAHYGGGGLSGKPLLPLVAEYVAQIRERGINKPINAGGGILSMRDVYSLYDFMTPGRDSIFLGSITMLRPWRVKRIIRKTNKLFERRG